MSDEYSSDSYGDGIDDEEDGEEYVPLRLQECGKCGRKFNPEALARHSKICTKVNKPRKQFDSKKQRLVEFQNEVNKLSAQSSIAPKKSLKKKDWRRQHEEFIKTIRAARGVTKAQLTGGELPPPPEPTYNPDYVECEYCNRRFNESAAERHIEFCKKQKSRLPKQSSDSKYDVKKNKMQIRTQYRPPAPGQKKKSLDGASSAKPRGGGYAASPASKLGSSTGRAKEDSPQVERNGTSNSPMTVGNRKTSKYKNASNDERPLNSNSRYSTTTSKPSRVSSGSSDEKTSAKKLGDPKWFEDLKRDSAGKARTHAQTKNHSDEIDSGRDFNDNFSPSATQRRNRDQLSNLVSPSSRFKEDIFENGSEKQGSAGRRKLANFCHDCGTKYPVLNAKFCCECGVRRMSIS